MEINNAKMNEGEIGGRKRTERIDEEEWENACIWVCHEDMSRWTMSVCNYFTYVLSCTLALALCVKVMEGNIRKKEEWLSNIKEMDEWNILSIYVIDANTIDIF